MTARFEKALAFTLPMEGGFVDHPADPGGATNHGVSLRALRQLEADNLAEWDKDGDGDVDADDMRLLTIDDARLFYAEHFWTPAMEAMTAPDHAIKLFDMAVNMGPKQAGKLFQRALMRCAPKAEYILIDGIVGPKTVAVADDLVKQGLYSLSLDTLASTQAKFYFDLVEAKRSREAFLFGWLRRAYELPA